ncbi:MAG: biotin--[acetyl-CoA-carboxylase] ligase [Oscillospiraceae bacterium]|nr:biotin--[acetyl-CoA-carboxylase] ligase [Oscillospiraceae bacterium]
MFNVLRFEQLCSTNDYMKENLSSLPHKTVVVARVQTNGRGRFERRWLSATGSLTFSYLLKDIKNPLPLTALNAVAVLRAIKRVFETPKKSVFPVIKWPNDILLTAPDFEGAKKVCGILCESRSFGDNFSVISGIGINLSENADFFIKNALDKAAGLCDVFDKRVEPDVLLCEILKELETVIFSDFKEYRQEYIDNCITIGQKVTTQEPDGTQKQTTAISVDNNAMLICRDENGEQLTAVDSGQWRVDSCL